MTNVKDNEYEIGYKRPPKDHQFKKGERRPRQGRKPKARGLAALLAAELDSKVHATSSGKRIVLKKRQMIANRIVARAMDGDVAMLRLLLRLDEQSGPAEAFVVEPRDLEALKAAHQRKLDAGTK